MKNFFRSLVLGVTLCWGFPTSAALEEGNEFEWGAWSGEPYSYASIGQELSSILEEWAEEMGIEIYVSDNINRQVWVTFQEGTGKEFFLKIAREQNLSWLYYGGKLYVYSKQEEEKEILRLDHISPEDFKEQLQQLEIFRDKFVWKTSPNIFMVIGPPKYVELIKEVASFLDNQDTLVIKVFPLKYSWVQDRAISTRGRQTTVPGLATVLTRLLFTSSQEDLEPEEASSSTLKMIPPPLPNKASIKPAKGAFIQADARRNALIIRDYSRNMPLYKAVIETLDKPTPLIEITMTILDTNVSDKNKFGMEFPTKLGFEINLKNPAKPFIMKTSKLDLTLNMLQSTGEGSVVSEPVVITMDNMEAVLDHSSTLHIKVEAERDAELVPITSGTMLRVTPHLIEKEGGEKFISLLLNIQDGSFGEVSESVGGIPTMHNSSINTQAKVNLDESLVVGGYYKETVQEETTGLPFFSKLPILAPLFSTVTQNRHTTRRLFIITPRIVENSYQQEAE